MQAVALRVLPHSGRMFPPTRQVSFKAPHLRTYLMVLTSPNTSYLLWHNPYTSTFPGSLPCKKCRSWHVQGKFNLCMHVGVRDSPSMACGLIWTTSAPKTTRSTATTASSASTTSPRMLVTRWPTCGQATPHVSHAWSVSNIVRSACGVSHKPRFG